jgi:hypothetical protein
LSGPCQVAFFRDLYRYGLKSGRWLRVVSPNSPAPRSGHHAAVVRHHGCLCFNDGFISLIDIS